MVEKILKLFKSELKVINIGLEFFYKSLKDQNVEAVHVVWQPPPKIEKDLQDILDKIL